MDKIAKDKLKLDSLKVSGRTVYNLPEYLYLKSFSYDDNNVIKVQYYVLLETSETEYDLITPVSKSYFEYTIADGKPFIDNDGNYVYKKDANGDTLLEDIEMPSVDENGEYILDENGDNVTEMVKIPVKRLNDYTRVYDNFKDSLIPYIFTDIFNHRGYHANEGGAVDNV